jgi:hypothetical protein
LTHGYDDTDTIAACGDSLSALTHSYKAARFICVESIPSTPQRVVVEMLKKYDPLATWSNPE